MNNLDVKIYPLRREDAYTSYQWRNNPRIWELTTNAPKKNISLEDEINWIEKVLAEKNSFRFSIHFKNKYVGNVQLTEIEGKESYFGIFIGDANVWGLGVGHKATLLILQYGFIKLNLKKIKLRVKLNHFRAYNLYKKIGFKEFYRNTELIHMEIKFEDLQ